MKLTTSERQRQSALKRWAKWREHGHNAFILRYGMLKQTARKRKHVVLISLDEYANLANLPCHYCGGKLPEFGSGIDRKDSSKDYTADNCVSCCSTCNDLKGHLLSYAEMVSIMTMRNLDDRLFLGGC